MAESQQLFSLTPAQEQISRLLLEGMDSNTIADCTGASVNTVKVHITAILEACSFGSQKELLAWALQRQREVYEGQIRALGAEPAPVYFFRVRRPGKVS